MKAHRSCNNRPGFTPGDLLLDYIYFFYFLSPAKASAMRMSLGSKSEIVKG